jgi:hypothetical protein
MNKLGKSFEWVTSRGAGHGLVKSQTVIEGNAKPTDESRPKAMAFFQETALSKDVCAVT